MITKLQSIITDLLSMPALSHHRDKGAAWSPQQSDVIRFIQFSGTRNGLLLSLDRAELVFYSARKNRKIYYDNADGLWRGASLNPDFEAQDKARRDAAAAKRETNKDFIAALQTAIHGAAGPKKTGNRSGRFKSKFTADQILNEAGIVWPDGVETIDAQLICKSDLRMSKATFFRLWRTLKADKRIIESNDKWFKAKNEQNSVIPFPKSNP